MLARALRRTGSRASSGADDDRPDREPDHHDREAARPVVERAFDECRHAGDPAARRDRHRDREGDDGGRERSLGPERRDPLAQPRCLALAGAAAPGPKAQDQRAPRRRKVAASTAKKVLSGMNESSNAASAQPPTESACAVAGDERVRRLHVLAVDDRRDRRSVGGREVARRGLEHERGDDEPPERQRAREPGDRDRDQRRGRGRDRRRSSACAGSQRSARGRRGDRRRTRARCRRPGPRRRRAGRPSRARPTSARCS